MMDTDGTIQPEPEAILDHQIVTKGPRAVSEVLVKWQGHEADGATGKLYHQLHERFPGSNLGDKVWGGNVTYPYCLIPCSVSILFV